MIDLSYFKLPQDNDDWSPAWRRAMVGDPAEMIEPINTRTQESGGRLYLPAGVLNFSERIEVTRSVVVVGEGQLNTLIRFTNPESAGIRFCFRGNCPSWHPEGYGAEARFEDVGLIGPGPNVGLEHGVLFEARAHLRNVHVQSFAGHAISFDADVNRTPSSGANFCTLFNVRATNCGRPQLWESSKIGAGVSWKGGDVNENVLVGVDVSSCQFGFYDESFLGNNGFGVHSGNNTYGALHAMKSSQRGRWFIYVESGDGDPGDNNPNTEGTISARPPNLLVNPRADRRDMVGNPAMIQPSSAEMLLTPFAVARTGENSEQNTPAARAVLRGGDADPTIAMSVEDTLGSDGSYDLRINEVGGHRDTIGFVNKGANSTMGLGWTTKDNSRGNGVAYAPQGILLGSGVNARLIRFADAPPVAGPDGFAADGYKTGDTIIKKTGQFEGWRYDQTANNGQGGWIAFC